MKGGDQKGVFARRVGRLGRLNTHLVTAAPKVSLAPAWACAPAAPAARAAKFTRGHLCGRSSRHQKGGRPA